MTERPPGGPRTCDSSALRTTELHAALFKTELIADRVWRTHTQLELAIVEYAGWFNDVRLDESLGDRPPGEYETLSPSSTLELSTS